jgi:hypothetical protein
LIEVNASRNRPDILVVHSDIRVLHRTGRRRLRARFGLIYRDLLAVWGSIKADGKVETTADPISAPLPCLRGIAH